MVLRILILSMIYLQQIREEFLSFAEHYEKESFQLVGDVIRD